jgi:hypothetical protein
LISEKKVKVLLIGRINPIYPCFHGVAKKLEDGRISNHAFDSSW